MSAALETVFAKLRPVWYPQLDAAGEEIPLREVNQRNVSLETPLIVAAQHLMPDDIQVLVEHGAELNAKSGSERHHAALHVARLMRRFDNAEKLVALGADVTLTDGIGKTPLDYGNLAEGGDPRR
jgi:ankyrin repeat protein